ncbi:MAG: DUF177 domain-containing protein [Acidobacteria bacterium]|nr:DUF177 domain-containing protein [Acidobacteriota bacterium]
MYIETKEIGPEGLIVDRVIEAFQLRLRDSEEIRVGRSRLSGELLKAGGISFSGDIETSATLPCSRCLESYPLPLDLHFNLLYTVRPEHATRTESRVDEERVTMTQFDGGRIDLAALLAEQVYLGLPLKPLCRADCRGLCPQCGTNRNQGTCGCQEARAEDPRLLIFKKLL